MNNYEKLERVASGIQAASSILRLISSGTVGDSRQQIKPDKLFLVSESLRILSEHLNNRQDSSLGKSLSKVASYGDVYRKLRQQYQATRGKKTDKKTLVEVMSTLRPVLNSRQQLFIDKVLKINEILET